MANLLGAIGRIKRDALGALDRAAVERTCDELGHAWRDRELDPATTVALFVQQILHGNVPCSEVRHIGAGDFTASAYCQARARLPLKMIQSLLTRVCDAALPETHLHEHLWLGRHRVFLIDGSTFSMPDTPASYNLVRVVMLEAAHRQSAPVSRMSFADALKWMRHARPDDRLPTLMLNPERSNRAEPRCKKRRPKQFDLMNRPRDELRKGLKHSGKGLNLMPLRCVPIPFGTPFAHT